MDRPVRLTLGRELPRALWENLRLDDVVGRGWRVCYTDEVETQWSDFCR